MNKEVEQRLLFHWPVITHNGTAPPRQIAPWTKRITNGLPNSFSSLVGLAMQTFPSRADLMAVEAREGVVALLAKHPGLCRKLSKTNLAASTCQQKRDQPPELENVVVLIEEYFGLLLQLPVYLTKQSLSWLQRYRPHFEVTSQTSKSHTKAEINGVSYHQHFGSEVIKRLRLIDADVAVGVINEIVAVRSIDVALDNKRQEELCAPVVYEVLEPILESLFCGFLAPDTLLYVWDQIVLCVAAQLPTEQCIIHWLSSVAAILLYYTWIRNPQESTFRLIPQVGETILSRSVATDTEENGSTKPKSVASNVALKSFTQRMQSAGRKLHVEDIKLLVSRHFYTRMFCIMSGMEKQSEISANPTIEAQSYWADWFSIIDQSGTSTVEQRADQRLLRFKELERVRQTETSLEATTKLLSQYKRELTESQKAVQQCQDETMRAKQKHQQLEDELKSWQTLVNKLEEKLEDANQQAYFYVEAARSSKLDSLNQRKENAPDTVADTSSSNVNNREANAVGDADKKKNTCDKSTSTNGRKTVHK
ncbi:hypothetical protein PHET_04111 [Paragonimus heterotremus]|uniref:Uncharacterized protein n=1 Tax=Paragonimus heterotremus TaxID=100268 RepID=A0A8J4WS53_9TREM|nr:hypothetical protein PHET_04111 [Paragonimus heterotremus]